MMEYVIAIFVGVWVAVAGLLAYIRIAKDFGEVNNDNNKEKGESIK